MTLSSYGFPVESRGLSTEQLGTVQAFKRLLKQSGTWDDRHFDEHDCARFLKARNYDVQAAKQMWDSMLHWRRENRVDTIRDWFVFHERPQYDAVFPTGLHKTDKEGHPVLIQQLGRVNIGALYKVTTDDRIRMAHIADNEHLRRAVFPACSRAAGRPIDQLFTIIDLEGVAFTSMMRTTSLLKMFMAMDSNNYPETLARMAIINAPGWFSTSWSAVKSVLSGDTVRKIQILGKDYKAALLQHIPRENLLVEYGGLSRGSITDNEGPWQEPIPEPPAPAVPAPLPSPKQLPAGPPAGASVEPLQFSSGGGDQRTPRDVSLNRRSQSPVRPGATKATTLMPPGTVASAPTGHPAPTGSPPLAKRPHYEDPQQQQPQGGLPMGSSPAPSVSDCASDTSQSMAAPLMSHFLPSTAEALSAQSPAAGTPQPQACPASPPLAGPGSGHGPAAATSNLRRGSSTGGSGGLVNGLVAGLQAVASHVGYHPHHSAARPAVVDVGPSGAVANAVGIPLRTVSASHVPAAPPSGGMAQRCVSLTPQPHPANPQLRGPGAGPVQLQLVSPREDTTGPLTMFSAVSAAFSHQSALSPVSPGELQTISDTATSRAPDSSAPGSAFTQPSGVLGSGQAGLATISGLYTRQISGGGSGIGLGAASQAIGVGQMLTGGSGSLYVSGMLQSGELALTVSQPPQVSSQQADTEDAESVRFSVMSQRSFYSALSHLDPSSSSGVTSPNEASENARRWSMQRELHAAAIASALAATAEQRRAAAAAAAVAAGTPQPSLPPTGNKKAAGMGPSPASPMPSALALASVTYPVPPAAQQAFGSYLDQPPPYGSMRTGDSSCSSTSQANAVGIGTGHGGRGASSSVAVTGGAEASCGQGAAARPGLPGPNSHQHHQAGQQGEAGARDAVILQVNGDGAGGLSRSPSGATIDDCSLGAGAVRWARGWFFRRRNYGRLVESDASAEPSGIVGSGRVAGGSGGGAGTEGGRQAGASMTRKGSSGALYASMQDGPGATSPSKVLPKHPAGVHHSRGNSWEWDQPSPYDIDQTYGRGGGIMQRDMSFGRGGERRRLLRTDSLGRRRSLGDYCGCLPCCTVM